MINPNPVCRVCGHDKFNIATKASARRWSCAATCLQCRTRTFRMGWNLLEVLAAVFPAPELEAAESAAG